MTRHSLTPKEDALGHIQSRAQIVDDLAVSFVGNNDQYAAFADATARYLRRARELLAADETDLDVDEHSLIQWPKPEEQWVTAPDGEEFRVGQCQGHAECPVKTHEHGCSADVGNCDHPEDHKPAEPVHWVGEPGEGPTSLHGNGAASFARTSGDEDEVTCKLCLTLLARESGDPSSAHMDGSE